jgi:hypothetical protein
MSHSRDYEDTGWTTAFYQGVRAGTEDERHRILEALRAKAATRTILETLAAPFYIEELEATIMEGQDD